MASCALSQWTVSIHTAIFHSGPLKCMKRVINPHNLQSYAINLFYDLETDGSRYSSGSPTPPSLSSHSTGRKSWSCVTKYYNNGTSFLLTVMLWCGHYSKCEMEKAYKLSVQAGFVCLSMQCQDQSIDRSIVPLL